MQTQESTREQDIERQLAEIEIALKEVEEKYQLLRLKGKDILTSAKGDIDATRLKDIRSRLGI
ncbi:MAG: hypothetical protein ABIT47_02300 [Candidatus Paceibacterota bacterium]